MSNNFVPAPNKLVSRNRASRLIRWQFGRLAVGLCCALSVTACATIGSTGPGASKVRSLDNAQMGAAKITVLNLTDEVARRVIATHRQETLLGAFGDVEPARQVIGQGDVLDITIWEAPPATLFAGSAGGSTNMQASANLTPQPLQSSNLPPQMVRQDGTVNIPFVGDISAAGDTTQQLERSIVAGLRGKAHAPQVLVRIAAIRSANVTVVGDVASSTAFPLSAKGERLLDALAAAGGVRQPTNKTTIRLTRGQRTASQPLDSILLDPAQNIVLRPGDVVTAIFKPYSFAALGAVSSNSEIPFEATGLTLAQALARVGGLQDSRSDIRGVFIFRLESPEFLSGPLRNDPAVLTPDGRVPVIYNLNLSDPRSFFIAQGFPIRDGDVLYVSNAPLADLQKFVSIVSSMTFSIIGIGNAVK